MIASFFGRLRTWPGWPRRVPAHVPLAHALAEHARSGRPQRVRVVRSGDVRYRMDTAPFFELEGEQRPIDAALLAACEGRVLDVGAGAGRHALALQERGLSVRAIDVSPTCVELMRSRGVRDARVADVASLLEEAVESDRFDTIVFGMQSIGIVGRVEGLEALLAAVGRARGALAPGGRILLDSSPPVGPGFARRIEFARAPELAGRAAGPAHADDLLAGETVVRFAHRGLRGAPFEWLYLGAGALACVAQAHGFGTEILVRLADSPEYLARLEPLRPA